MALELINPALSNQAGQNWALGGSPGAANPSAANDIAPLIRNTRHSPAIPRSTDTVQVEADIDDESPGGDTATLHWRVSRRNPQAAFNQITMEDNNANGRWEADIPAHPNGTVIEFFIEASDGHPLPHLAGSDRPGTARQLPLPGRRGDDQHHRRQLPPGHVGRGGCPAELDQP